MTRFADRTVSTLLRGVAAPDPTPGAGPTLAITAAFAAALVEMVTAVTLRADPDAEALPARQERAAQLREQALDLAEEDAVAFRGVMAVMRRRDEPGHGQRLREALAEAADPPMRIVELAAEVASLAADATQDARGGVRGEAITAVTLAESVVRAGGPILSLNLAGSKDDPRITRAAELAAAAEADVRRAQERPRG
ncbi:MAG TPA: cyclodeaminase/cyclohydrolase family protein [Capillimicrobium sp.]|nr:cyclodeaminase/cyclohydrolase family protein [Capillimicrobium sp.]